MAYQVIVDNINREDWERYAADFADYSIYQTWAYQQVRADMDHCKTSRCIVKNTNDNIEMMCIVRIKHLKPLGLRIGYVQWGPLMKGRDGDLKCTVNALMQLQKVYIGEKINILRIVPHIYEDGLGRAVSQMLLSIGFRFVSNVKPYNTMTLSLENSEENLRKGLHRNWRRNLQKAENAGIEIRQGCENELFDILERLYLKALERKRFKGLNPDQFTRTQRMLFEREKLIVTVAYFDGEPVTALATSNLGDTGLDILAANNEKGLKCGSSFLTYWNAFDASRRAGMKRYDLGGIDPKNNPTVYQFKSRMGGEVQFHIGAFEAYANTVVRKMWTAANTLRNIFKR
jgi:lipid II:glycine glycyltransferase (peptidoglycan interpeptide bridge formation enzyme)